jgi:hypothetical protein
MAEAERYTPGVMKYKFEVHYIATAITIISEHLKINEYPFCVCTVLRLALLIYVVVLTALG